MKKWILLLFFMLIAVPAAHTEASSFREVKALTTATVLHISPNETSTTVTTIAANELVTQYTNDHGWSYVTYKHWHGYVQTTHLKSAASTIKIASSKSGLVVRATPSPSAKGIATLTYNMIVEDYGAVGAGWSFVQYGNVTGYVATSFIGTPATQNRTAKQQLALRNIASPSGVVTYTIPANTKVKVHSTLAGWAYVSIDHARGYVEAAKLKAAQLIVIDAGHQLKGNSAQEPVGPGAKTTKAKVTSGTTGVATKKPEYVLTLEAALILRDQLQQQGYDVRMVRTTHNVNISNRERATFANNLSADLVIRLHGDGSTNKNTRGLTVLVPGKNAYTGGIYTESDKAGKAILNAVKPHVVLYGSGYSYRTDLSGFNWSTVPSVLVEMGFMTNPTEDKLLSNKTYLTNLMSYITNGVNQYFAH